MNIDKVVENIFGVMFGFAIVGSVIVNMCSCSSEHEDNAKIPLTTIIQNEEPVQEKEKPKEKGLLYEGDYIEGQSRFLNTGEYVDYTGGDNHHVKIYEDHVECDIFTYSFSHLSYGHRVYTRFFLGRDLILFVSDDFEIMSRSTDPGSFDQYGNQYTFESQWEKQ